MGAHGRTEAEKTHVALVEKYVRPGDLLTYTVCMQHMQEAFYEGRHGYWMTGRLAPDTLKIEQTRKADAYVDDISPLHVTHINRDPIAAIPELVEIDRKWKERA